MSITIPDSVTSIEITSFYDYSNLNAIVVGEGNVNYTDVDGVLFNSKKTS